MQKNSFFRSCVRLLTAVLMLIMSMPSMMMAADDWSYPTSEPSNPFGGGKGTWSDPYIISSAQHLANLAYMVSNCDEDYEGKYFRQTKDIVLNDNVLTGVTKEADGSIRYKKNAAHFDALKRWQPIGMYGSVWDSDFEGIYDGDGHSISGIYCRKPIETAEKAYRYIGLFGTCYNARISDLTIKDSFFSICAPNNDLHDVSFGSLVGHAENTIITKCHAVNCVISSDGDIKANKWNVGGLIGEIEGTFTGNKCSYDGVVDAYTGGVKGRSTAQYYIGGLIGAEGVNDRIIKQFEVEDCTTSGTLLCHEANRTDTWGGYAYVGGIIGNLHKAESEAFGVKPPNFSRCINRMNINVYGDDSTFPDHEDIRVSGIACGSHPRNYECVNFGNISFGGSIPREQNSKATILISGICDTGKAIDCFNYGNIDMGTLKSSKNVYIDQWLSYSGTLQRCFAYNTIKYNFQDGGTIDVCDTPGSGETLNRCYTTVNGVVKKANMDDDDATYFTNQDVVDKLNDAAGATKYGLIKEEGFGFDGYLSLTSLGAMANSLYGYGTEAAPYIISNASDLRSMEYMLTTNTDFTNSIFELTANIDMTDEPEIYQIGDFDHPFKGIFDGNGHYIRGMKAKGGAMFHTVRGGTIKNLALDDFKSTKANVFAGIALYVDGGGIIENCYVTGDADLKMDDNTNDLSFGGICYTLNGTISNCYYTGNVRFSNTEQDGTYIYPCVGGIAAKAYGEISNSYAVFNFQNDLSAKMHAAVIGGITSVGTSLKNNFYQFNITDKEQTTTIMPNTGATSVDKGIISASELGEAWLEGMTRPVLKSAYHYACQDYEGNNVGLDPAGYTPTNNSILTIIPTAEQKEDTKLWQLPNVAVYSDDLDAEILTNFTIIDGVGDNYSLRYNPTKDGVSVKGLVTYPWKVEPNYVNWHSFCLPGSVDKSNLPEGCKLYVGGTYANNKMNIVEVEQVPAGVPFLIRYDNKTDADIVYITMTGDLKMQPQTADAASSLKGTFENISDMSYIFYIAHEETTDGNTKIYMHNGSSVDAFRAYVVGDNTGLIELTDYLLLDEQSNHSDDVISANDGKTLNIKLRRNIKTGGWNTVCLPFNVSKDEIETSLGTATSIEELTSISYDATSASVVLQFSAASSIEAGKPYLVYPEKEGNIFDLGARTIVGNTADKTYDVTFTDGSSVVISMIGSYGKTALLSTDAENQYFIQQDKLYRVVGNPVVSLGYRCWFKATDATGSQAQQLKSARIIHADGSATEIKLVDTGLGNNTSRIYDLQGIQHSEMQRGLNIAGGKKIMKK